MLFTSETALDAALLLSDAFSLPARIYLSPWGEAASCEISRRLCSCFVCDGPLLHLACRQKGDCIIISSTEYGESTVLLSGRTALGRQFVVLGPAAAAGVYVPPEAFPSWDTAGFQRVHNQLPVRNPRQLEAIGRLSAQALDLRSPVLVRQGEQTASTAPARHASLFPSERPCTPQDYRRQLIHFVRQGDRVGLARVQVLYADLNSPAPVGEQALRARKNDFIRFLELLTDTAIDEGADFSDLMALSNHYIWQAERLPSFSGLAALYNRASCDWVRRVAAQKGLPSAPGSVEEALDYIDAAGCALSAGDVARQLGMTTQQLNRQFKAVMGFSLSDYITLCRMVQARYLLCTEIPVSEVAQSAHFSSVNSMDAAFHRFLHVSPLAYRRIKLRT